MKVQAPVLPLAIALGIFSAACATNNGQTGTGGSSQSGGSTGSGGSSQSGGSTGSGGSSSQCTNVSACGGNLVGSWTVSSSCLDISDSNLDTTAAGLSPATCQNVSISGSLHVSGTWTAKSDGTYTDGTTTTGTLTLQLPNGCRMLSGTTLECNGLNSPLSGMGFSSVDCQNGSNNGCTCTAMVNQSGMPGIVSLSAMTSGDQSTSGNTLTLDGMTNYDYCVSGTQLTMTPKTTSPTTKGSIVFAKGSSSGSGGSTGSGGSVSTGGTTGSGGSSSGGTTGSGGAKGGNTGSGGSAAGSTGSGGAKGGNTGSGGSAAGSTGSGGSAAGSTGSGGSSTGGGSGRTDGPCDIYSAAGQPCAAAYSTIRALSKSYTGFLYQVRNGSSSMNTGSGGTTKDIGMTADGFADTATQDAFCTSICTFSLLYDQSGNGNNLKVAPAGNTSGGTYSNMPDFESSATKDPRTFNGHKVYALYMNAREGYRLTSVGKGMPTGAKAQGIYELVDGTHWGKPCCWDFGDVSTDPLVYTTMNTIFFGTGYWGTGAGSGPWFLGDFEGGVWATGSGASNANNPNDPSMGVQFAFGIVKTSPPTNYAIRVANGNLPSATTVNTAYSGPGPKTWNNTGGILLGIGSDNSNNSYGTFYEGAITNGQPSDTTDMSVFSNVKAAGYK